jgi:3-hydroxyacyl-CoA dehydrogenase
MIKHVRRVAVLGSGVMGSAIAAHFANAGVPSLLLDLPPRELDDPERRAGLDLRDRRVRDRLATRNLAAALRARPSPFFVAERAALIEPGNLEDDLPRLAEVDWVIEAVREDMAVKRELLPRVAAHLRSDALLSSNTSGLSLTAMAETLPAEVRPRFLGTHFFNPPRYMRLLELIPTVYTSAATIRLVSDFARLRLGKGVVPAKDTPNFIANRIGLHAMMVALRVQDELGLTLEEVDALTGPPLARPRTGTFRLADLIGVDTLLLVARNVHGLIPGDESRDVFLPPDWLARMVERDWLGKKSGSGFYKKAADGRILTLDPSTLEHREPRPPDLPGLERVRASDPRERVRAVLALPGRTGEAAWRLLAPTLSYSAMRLGEIADDTATIDRAMQLGFNWELGPFEIWDALGFRATAERLRAGGYPLPEWVDGRSSVASELPADPRALRFSVLRAAGAEVERNESASLVDLGEGVLALEFHSKMNAIDAGTIAMMTTAVERAESGFRALVVANDGESFSAGANLKLLLDAAERADWTAIERMVRSFQHANDRLERAAVPVVVAPHGTTLGGGCEIALAGTAIHAAAESYIGLVEVGAGVIPAGGGCLRLYERLVAGAGDPYPALKSAFETIGKATVSSSAEQARRLGFLRPQDGFSMNREYVTADAKDRALALAAAGHVPPPAARRLPVLGRSGLALLEAALVNMHEGRFVSAHDRRIGRELATVLSGGDIAGPTSVGVGHLLDLECEGFLRLCGEPKTHERIRALLTTGKPLRN